MLPYDQIRRDAKGLTRRVKDEAWWKPGRNCEIEPPSQRLTQRAPLDQGWPEDEDVKPQKGRVLV